MNGTTFKVGLQGSVSALKSVASGLPSGLTVSGDSIVVRQAGIVLDGYDFRGYSVAVAAHNVTIKNSLFNATGQHTVQQGANASGMVLEFNTFDGGRSKSRLHNDMVLSDNSAIIRNNEFFNVPTDAINTAGGLVEQNYLAGASYQVGAHADGISVHRTAAPLTIRSNYIDFIDRSDAPQGTNAAIKIVSHFGTVNDVKVDSNVLYGGGYTIYAGQDKYAIANVHFTNNDVGFGKHGALMKGNHGANFVYANVGGIDASGSAAPTPSKPAGGAPEASPSKPAGGAPEASSGGSMQGPPAVAAARTQKAAPADTIVGTNKFDALYGTDGRDVISLKGGSDYVEARNGNDVIKGGGGKDWMIGQAGNDVFVYTALADSRRGESSRDVILDWGNGNDKIDLRSLDANVGNAGNQAFTWIGSKAYSGTAGELRYASNGFKAIVGGDVDGDGKSDVQIELRGFGLGLSITDFYL